MSNTLLVPVDLQDPEPPWLDTAYQLARDLGCDVALLHVVDYVPTVLPVELPSGYPLPQLEVVREAAQKRMEVLAKRFEGVHTTILVEDGAAGHEIAEAARSLEARMIVIGSHSRGAVTRMLLGSVAERVARTATCPVTIVRMN